MHFRLSRAGLLLAELGLAALTLPFLVACRQPGAAPDAEDEPPQKAAWFEDVTEKVRLSFVHDAGPGGSYFMPLCMGSGGALIDFNNDGRLDLYLVHNGGRQGKKNQLFRQQPDGTFADVSAGSGLDVAGHGMGVAVGDVNNDGWPDVVLAEYCAIRLFVNNGDGTFVERTREAGLDNPLWASSAAFLDYDRDGWLDLVVVNYLDYEPSRPCAAASGRPDFCGPQHFPGSVTKLYRNCGGATDRTHRPCFEDVTLAAGLGNRQGPGLGVVSADFDGDGWVDIFVTNDGKPNHLWVNQKDGTFQEEAVQRGLALNALGQTAANMGVTLGDVDGKGLFSLYVTHLTEETNTLWQQQPCGVYQDRTMAAGLLALSWRGTGFGTVFGDFDHDGALDLALVNGRVAAHRHDGAPPVPTPDVPAWWGPYAERNQLAAGVGDGRFQDISLWNAAFCGAARVGRGLMMGDVDNDGALDLVVTNIAGPARLYRNCAPDRGHWLLVRAVDPVLQRDAYGAEVTVVTAARRWKAWLTPASSYQCSNDPRAHFGLGSVEQVDSMKVLWPDGTGEVFPGGPVDRVVTLHKGQGRPRRQP